MLKLHHETLQQRIQDTGGIKIIISPPNHFRRSSSFSISRKTAEYWIGCQGLKQLLWNKWIQWNLSGANDWRLSHHETCKYSLTGKILLNQWEEKLLPLNRERSTWKYSWIKSIIQKPIPKTYLCSSNKCWCFPSLSLRVINMWIMNFFKVGISLSAKDWHCASIQQCLFSITTNGKKTMTERTGSHKHNKACS